MSLENQGNARHRVLCLWLPNWPIQRLVVALPELRKQRVVLFSQDARRRQVVVAASPRAQLEGVQVNSPLTEAKALLSRAAHRYRRKRDYRRKSAEKRRVAVGEQVLEGNPASGAQVAEHCLAGESETPFFRIFQHVPQDDHDALQSLAAELDSFSPIVGLQTGVGNPDCLLLDISGLAPLFGSEVRLAKHVRQFCQSQGYLVRIGVAHTLGLAQGIAKHATQQRSSITIVSVEQCQQIQVENRTQTPGSICCFEDMPVSSLRLKSDTNQLLEQLGIFRIGQLLQVPRRELFSRFGDEIYVRLDQMSGRIEEPIQACPRPKEFYAEQLLDHPTPHKETLEVVLEHLVQGVCKQLKGCQRGALQWTIRLFGQQRLPLKLQVRLFAPTFQSEHVIPLVKMQMEQMFQPELTRRKRKQLSSAKSDHPVPLVKKEQWIHWEGCPLDVSEITVTVTSSVLMANRQRELFDENPRADKQALAHLVNRLTGRLGYRNVVVPSLVSGNQPEFAYQLKPLVHVASRRNGNTLAPVRSLPVMHRPLRMIHPAQPIEIVSLSPSSVDSRFSPWKFEESSPPVTVQMGQRNYRIIQHWGPERIETGWWQGKLIRRDYWKIELHTHQQFWVYFDLRQQRWFLQGEF